MFDNVVASLGSVYSSFDRHWDRTMKKIMSLSPGDLEVLDREIRKLERFYEIYGMRRLSRSLGTYPDEYARKIRSLRENMQDTIAKKFALLEKEIRKDIKDPSSVDDFEEEQKLFNRAISSFRMLKIFFRRWRLDLDRYCSRSVSDDFKQSLKMISHDVAVKKAVLMSEHARILEDAEKRGKSQLLEQVSAEISRIGGWYQSCYGLHDPDGLRVPVDTGTILAPLERFRSIPSSDEVDDVQKLLESFSEFYRLNSIIPQGKAHALHDPVILKDVAASTEDEHHSALLMQLVHLHSIIDDAHSRRKNKADMELMLSHSFAMYFAPVDEVYDIIRKGFISPEGSLRSRFSGSDEKSLVLDIGSDIRDGDMGFIFPLTRVLQGNRFFVSSVDGRSRLHLFAEDDSLRLDVRSGIFIAPRDFFVKHKEGKKIVKESTHVYFRRLFENISDEWLDKSRLDAWLSRHCIFYDKDMLSDILGMLKDMKFVSVMDSYTNTRIDNLSFTQVFGSLRYAGDVMHSFDISPVMRKELGRDTFRVSTFGWV